MELVRIFLEIVELILGRRLHAPVRFTDMRRSGIDRGRQLREELLKRICVAWVLFARKQVVDQLVARVANCALGIEVVRRVRVILGEQILPPPSVLVVQ